jgi:hypothetical protein
MKEVMQALLVLHNYLRSVFDKLLQLKQGSMSVNEYYMEMEMLLQRARVHEPLEQTLQRFLHGLKYNIKSIVRHHRYRDMNELLHHAREAEAQFAEEAQFKARNTLGSHFTPRPAAPIPSSRSDFCAPSSSRSDSNAKKIRTCC